MSFSSFSLSDQSVFVRWPRFAARWLFLTFLTFLLPMVFVFSIERAADRSVVIPPDPAFESVSMLLVDFEGLAVSGDLPEFVTVDGEVANFVADDVHTFVSYSDWDEMRKFLDANDVGFLVGEVSVLDSTPVTISSNSIVIYSTGWVFSLVIALLFFVVNSKNFVSLLSIGDMIFLFCFGWVFSLRRKSVPTHVQTSPFYRRPYRHNNIFSMNILKLGVTLGSILYLSSGVVWSVVLFGASFFESTSLDFTLIGLFSAFTLCQLIIAIESPNVFSEVVDTSSVFWRRFEHKNLDDSFLSEDFARAALSFDGDVQRRAMKQFDVDRLTPKELEIFWAMLPDFQGKVGDLVEISDALDHSELV